MSTTVKQFRRPSPQPWKLEVPRRLDLDEEFNVERGDEPTSEFHITEPDDYMAAFDDEADTREWAKLDE